MIRAMKRGGKTAICVFGSVLFVVGAEAVTSDRGRYNGIVERNVFNLHPPPKPPSADDLAAQNKQPPPKITLTGITTILGKKVTFLTVAATKPGMPPEALMLAEGQGQSEVEVKEIDEKAGVVKVNNHGVEETLDFDHNGTKPSGPPPGSVPAPSQLPPPPGVPPSNVNPAQPPPNFIRPVRPGALPSRTPLSNTPMGGGFGSASASGGAQDEPLTSEQAAALIAIQTEKYKMEGNPTYKIMPPISG